MLCNSSLLLSLRFPTFDVMCVLHLNCSGDALTVQQQSEVHCKTLHPLAVRNMQADAHRIFIRRTKIIRKCLFFCKLILFTQHSYFLFLQ